MCITRFNKKTRKVRSVSPRGASIRTQSPQNELVHELKTHCSISEKGVDLPLITKWCSSNEIGLTSQIRRARRCRAQLYPWVHRKSLTQNREYFRVCRRPPLISSLRVAFPAFGENKGRKSKRRNVAGEGEKMPSPCFRDKPSTLLSRKQAAQEKHACVRFRLARSSRLLRSILIFPHYDADYEFKFWPYFPLELASICIFWRISTFLRLLQAYSVTC